MIRITINESVKKPGNLTVYEIPDMATLESELRNAYTETEDKTDSDLLVPVAEWRQLYRKADNIERLSRLFAVDLDRITQDQLIIAQNALDSVSCIFYTTHSHLTPRKDGLLCYRVLIELDREYNVADYPLVWHAINRRLGDQIDPATLDHPELGYYLPSAPPSYGHYADLVRNDGTPLHVDDLVSEARALGVEQRRPKTYATPPEKNGTPPNIQALKAQISVWLKSRHTDTANLAGYAKAIIEDKHSIPVGEGRRNTDLFALAGLIGRQWPYADPGAIAELFKGVGWDYVSPDQKYPLEVFAGMISRGQDYALEQAAEERVAVVQDMTAGRRSDTLTNDELERIIEIYGGRWQQHLVAVRHRDCYLLQTDGRYAHYPHPKENLFLACRDRFAVFGDWVEYDYIDSKGATRPKSLTMFLEEYGTAVENTVYDWTRSGRIWDPLSSTIYLEAPQPKVEPVGSEEIQDWLDHLDPIFCDMLSQMPYHDRMLPILILTGDKSCGKTMIANGIGQIYSDSPSDADKAFGEYNASVLKQNPILFADEKAPVLYRTVGTTLFRRFVTTRVHRLNEKFQSMIELHGFLRLIIAGNSTGLLNTEEDMSSTDRDAFAERLVHVDLTPGKEYLERIGKKRIHEEWLGNRALAKHILYLVEHWEVRNPGRRLAVEQPLTKFHEALASHSGTTQNVLCWLLHYLDDPAAIATKNLPVQISKGELRCNAKAIVQGWDTYMSGYLKPPEGATGAALAALSSRGRQRLDTARGRAHAYAVDRRQLEAANEIYNIVFDLDEKLGG